MSQLNGLEIAGRAIKVRPRGGGAPAVVARRALALPGMML